MINLIRALVLTLSFILFFTDDVLFANPQNLQEARNNYCKVPPFIQQNIFANLLLVIDLSGSMRYKAYGDDSYNSEEKYPGIFDATAYYACYDAKKRNYKKNVKSCDSNYKYWVKIADNVCKANSSSPCNEKKYYSDKNVYARSGNYLNWLYLKRIDVIRWVLTGGRTDNIFGTEIVELYSGQGVKSTDVTSYNPNTGEVEGILQKISRNSKKPRIGAYFFQAKEKEESCDPDNNYITSKVALSYDYTNLIKKINSVEVHGYTPTRCAMEDTLNYFSLKNGIYGGFSINNNTNPYIFKINNEYEKIRCTKNYVLLMTDGEWNTGGDPLSYVYDMWEGGYADLVPDLDGNQNAKLYSVALFLDNGKGKNAVKHFAIFGGFEDIDGNKMPCGYDSFPSSSKNKVVDISDPAYSSCRNEWDANKDKLPDTFADGSNPEKVKKSIEKIFERILADISSGTSVSVLSEKKSRGSILVQAIFSPQRYINGYKVKWIGQLFSYWFLNKRNAQNIREDTNNDKVLNIKDDNIIKFTLDENGKLKIDVYQSDTQGKPSTKVGTYFSLDEINYLWEAGEILKDTDANDRTLYTVSDTGKLVEFTTTNLSDFQDKLGTDIKHFPECLQNGSNIDYEKLVRYVRGEDIPGCRSRKVDDTGNNAGDIWKLGDIIYSTPKIVKYSNYSVVYTASNDGILHAFKVGNIKPLNVGYDVAKLEGTNLGDEIWGFIPSTSLTFLRYLADPDYCHMYIHDLAPYIFHADYDNDGEENTVLIGGLRLGGGCSCSGKYCVQAPSDNPNALSEYYALDITDPENPKLLWEFKNKDLGFSYSGPGIIKANNNKYYVVFASGPTSYSAQYNSSATESLKIFILNLQDGSLERTIDTNIKKAFAGRIFSQGYDLNNNGYTDFLVFGYTKQDSDATSYKGGLIFLAEQCEGNKIYPLDTDSDPNNWQACNVTSLGTDIPPITAKVEFGKCFNKWYLFLGTGRWFEKDDDWEVQSNNILFGTPLKPDTGSGLYWDYSHYNYIEIQTNIQDVSDINNVDNICSDNSQNGNVRGWYLRLSNAQGKYLKEKAISNPSVTDKNIVFFPTIFPSGDYCDYGGKTRVWALNCATGDAVFSTRCPGYKINVSTFDFLLQLSGGNIKEFTPSSFNKEDGRASEKVAGVASEEGGVPLFPNNLIGEILLWIEK